MKLRLIDFDSNTYEDTNGSCEMCMSTGMYDHPIYTFMDSYGGVHTVDGWWQEWGFLYSYDVNVPVFTYWLHTVEFKDIAKIIAEDEDYNSLEESKIWGIFLMNILDSASYCSTEQELSKNLMWALEDSRPETARL